MVESLEGETWRDIGTVDGVNMSGLYIVSDFGRIFMFERDYYRKDGAKVHMKEKLVPYHDNGRGYLYGCLFNDEISRKFYVHRVVATVYVPNPDPEHKTDVNHLDENKSNNKVDNLSWVTPKENDNWGTHAQRISDSQSKTPTLQLDLEGNIIKCWKSAREADRNGWNYNMISCVLTGKMYTYKGYIWMKKSVFEEMGKDSAIEYCHSIRDMYKVVQLDMDNNFIKLWERPIDTKLGGFNPNGVCACINNRQSSHKGFRWMKLNDYKKIDK